MKKRTGKEHPASKFLICHRRKNRPQVSPQVCEKRCRHRYRCPSFFEYLQPPLFAETETASAVESLRKQRKGRKIAAEKEPSAELLPAPAPPRLL